MELQIDNVILWESGPVRLNLTLAGTWMVMAVLVLGSWLVTRGLSVDSPSRWQLALEAVVEALRRQVREIMETDPAPYLPFLGTLFLFISMSSLLSVLPGFTPPTGSLSTTAALAVCVFVAVPAYGVARLGLFGYLAGYVRPNPLMLPFNVMGELTRTLALAVRLFGNMMSGAVLAALLMALTPLLFPVVMKLFDLLIGQVQAYIFAVLATVYISSAIRAGRPRGGN